MNPIKHAWGLKTASQLTVRKHLPRPGIGNFSLCRLDSECYSSAGHTSLSHSLSSETVMQNWPRATHEPIATVCANKTLSWKTCGSLELYQQPVLVNSWPRFSMLGLKAWRGLEIREQKTSGRWAWVLLIVVPSREEICDCLLQVEHFLCGEGGESAEHIKLTRLPKALPQSYTSSKQVPRERRLYGGTAYCLSRGVQECNLSFNTTRGGIYLHLSFSCAFGVNRNSLLGKTHASRALSSSKCCKIPFLCLHQVPFSLLH